MRWSLIAGAALLLHSGVAHAGASNAVVCGSSPADWNVPNGSLVFLRSDGPIAAMIKAAGEYRTHVEVAHVIAGQDGSLQRWLSHAMMKAPGYNLITPFVIPADLIAGYPGAEQVGMGAAYTLHQNAEFQRYQTGGTGGLTVASWLWTGTQYYQECNGSDCYYRIKTCASGSCPIRYGLYPFRNSGGVENGTSADGTLSSWNDATHCAGLVTWAVKQAGQPVIQPYTYSHSKLSSALYTMYQTLKTSCSEQAGYYGYMGSFLNTLFGICNSVANQVTNCLVSGPSYNCADTHKSIWEGVAINTSTTARSTSPDRLGGWSGHPWDGTTGPWAPFSDVVVQWNQGGSKYGCWAQ